MHGLLCDTGSSSLFPWIRIFKKREEKKRKEKQKQKQKQKHNKKAAFQLYTGYSATSFYEQWTLASYNLFFSSLPVIFIGIFEQDLDAPTLLQFPRLYQIGIKSSYFNVKGQFWTELWISSLF